MVKDAQSHADEDKKRREEIEVEEPRGQPDLLHREDARGEPREAARRPTSAAAEQALEAARKAVGGRRARSAIEKALRGADPGLAPAGRVALQGGRRGRAGRRASGARGRSGGRGQGRRRRDRRRGGGQEVGRADQDGAGSLRGARRAAGGQPRRSCAAPTSGARASSTPHLNPGDPGRPSASGTVAAAFEVLSDPQRRAAYDRGERAEAARACRAEGALRRLRLLGRGAGRARRASARSSTASCERRETGAERAARGGPRAGARASPSRSRSTAPRAGCTSCGTSRAPACAGAGEVAFGPVPCRALPRHGPGAGQPRPHDLLAALRRLRRAGRAQRARLRALPRRGRAVPGASGSTCGSRRGSASGSRVRLPGCGNAGPPRRAARRLRACAIEVEPHPVFRREGDDLHCDVARDMVEAALGGHVEVLTPDGPVTIELPAGTQNGQRFRLRKRGMPELGDGGRGDLYVEARVVVPAVTDDARPRAAARVRAAHPRAARGPAGRAGPAERA